MMKNLMLIFAVMLSACSTVNPLVAGYEKGVQTGVQGANDNLIHGIEASICAVPYGAIIRNPEFVPIATAACLPTGDKSNPVMLLPVK